MEPRGRRPTPDEVVDESLGLYFLGIAARMRLEHRVLPVGFARAGESQKSCEESRQCVVFEADVGIA